MLLFLESFLSKYKSYPYIIFNPTFVFLHTCATLSELPSNISIKGLSLYTFSFTVNPDLNPYQTQRQIRIPIIMHQTPINQGCGSRWVLPGSRSGSNLRTLIRPPKKPESGSYQIFT